MDQTNRRVRYTARSKDDGEGICLIIFPKTNSYRVR